MHQAFRRCLRSRRHPLSLPVVIFCTFASLVMMTVLLEPPQTHLFTSARLKIFGNEISCYREENLPRLQDISELKSPPEPDNGIFFHETSCKSYHNGRIVIYGRQACAVESAALLHPSRSVYLLFTSPGEIKTGIGDETDLALNALNTYKNIHIAHLNFQRYINNTPLQNLYTSGSIELSKYAGSHASDVLRYLTLWKYGGVYLDLDVVVTKNFTNLGPNFAGSESQENVAAGVLGLSHEGPGHEWAQRCLDDLSRSFSGSDWGHNGPGVITRLLQELCQVTRAKDMKSCQGFQVLPKQGFYPVSWWNWTSYFDPLLTNATLKIVEDSYAIHVWNKHSQNQPVPKNSAYGVVAKRFCPKVFEALQDSSF